MPRFLLFSTIFYVLGIILGRCCFALSCSILIIAGALAWAFFNLYLKKEGPKAILPFALLFLAAGSLAFHFSLQKTYGNLQNFTGERCTLIGSVGDEPLWLEAETVFPLVVEKIILRGEEHPAFGTVRVTLHLDSSQKTENLGGESREIKRETGREKVGQEQENDGAASFSSLSYGRKVALGGVLYEPQQARNPGNFNFRSYLQSRGIGAVFYGKAADLVLLDIPPGLSPLRRAALAAREKMSAVLRAYLPPKEGSLLVGMLFGERKALDPDMERVFRASGLSHLLAVSGLHVGLIAAFIFWLSQKAGLKGWQAFLFIFLLLFAYVYLCGLKPATLRAFIMVLMAAGAVQFGRSNDLPTALAAAALVILIYNPLLLFTVSFQLSYAATITIILFARPLTEKISQLGCRMHIPFSSTAKALYSLAAVTLAAQIGVAPLTAYYFKEISLIALFSNILIMPAVSAVLGIGLASALLGLAYAPAGAVMNLAGYPLLAYISLITEKIGSLPFAYREVYPPRLYELIIYYALLLFASMGFKPLLPFTQRLRKNLRPFHLLAFILLAAFVLTWWGFPGASPENLEIVFLDVGQGDAIYIHTPSGHNILLDGGGNPAFKGNIDSPGRYRVVPFLEHRRVKKLDLVFVSHPHEDHFGGLFAVLEKIPVETLVLNGDITETPLYQEFLSLAEKKGISREIVEKGDRFLLGEHIELEILNPPPQLFRGTRSDANNNSLVIHLRYKNFGALFTGDIEKEAAEHLLKEELLPPCQILKIPHHGAYLENLEKLLERVSPVYAIIPVGTNSFGHPHETTLCALQKKNVGIYRTDLHGAVTVVTDGHTFKVQTYFRPLQETEPRRQKAA